MKHLRALKLVLVTALALFSGSSFAQADDAQALEIVKRVAQKFVTVDLAAAGELYTEDALLMEPGVYLEGREAVQKWNNLGSEEEVETEAAPEDAEAGGVFAVPVLEAGFLKDENMVFGRGMYGFTNEQGEFIPEGYWQNIFKKEDGVWKIHRQMAVPIAPLAEGAEGGEGN